ncbi:MAG: ABC transporter permease, partial [Thermoanaerobaculia bacterium]
MSDAKKPAQHPLIELTVARLKEFGREPDVAFWVFAFPLLLTIALGFAFREKAPDRIPVGVTEGPFARQRLAALKKSPTLIPRIYSANEGREELRRGQISLLVNGDGAPVYRLDPTRPESRTARVEVDAALQVSAGRRDAFRAKEEHVTEQGSRYIDFLVPGLLGMNIMGTGMWSVGYSIVNARLRKLLKRLVATPMRKTHYLLSHFAARLVFLVVEVASIGIVAWLVFDVSIRGSLPVFALTCLIGAATFAGLGVLIGSRADTIEAVSGLMNVVMMPMWICSGVFFSYERFPDAVKPLIRVLPLTALNDALRAVINDGYGLAHIVPQLAILMAWAL